MQARQLNPVNFLHLCVPLEVEMKVSEKLISIVGSAAVLLIPAVASAGTVYLYTAPLWADDPSYHVCSAANVSTSDVSSVKVEVLAADGSVLVETTPVPLPAGQIVGATNVDDDYTGNARCRVTVKGSASKIRGNLVVFRQKTSDGNGDYHDVLGTEIAR